MLNIYLSGNMTPTPEAYEKWTSEFKETFQLPCKVFKAGKLKCHKQIVQTDLYMLQKSDIVIVNLGVPDINDHMTGAVVEVYEAYRQGKLVFGFTGNGLVRSKQSDSPWFKSFITKELDNIDDLMEYLYTVDFL